MSYLEQLPDKVWQFRYGQVKDRLDKVCNTDDLWENWAKVIINTLDQGLNYIQIKNKLYSGVMDKINQDPYYQGHVWKFKDDLKDWVKAFNEKYHLDPDFQVRFNEDKRGYPIQDQILIWLDLN